MNSGAYSLVRGASLFFYFTEKMKPSQGNSAQKRGSGCENIFNFNFGGVVCRTNSRSANTAVAKGVYRKLSSRKSLTERSMAGK
jgi:hypothetical protein